MSRYVDADALKENCYKKMDELMESTSEHLSAEALSLLCGFTLIDSAPSIDIVRCRECKYASDNKVYGCMLNHFNDNDYDYHRMYANDFCSRGERKSDE